MPSVTLIYHEANIMACEISMEPPVEPYFLLPTRRLRNTPDSMISTASQDLTRPSVTLIFNDGHTTWEDTSLPSFSLELLFLCAIIGHHADERISVELLTRGRNKMPWLGEERDIRYSIGPLRTASLALYNADNNVLQFDLEMLSWLYQSLAADPVEERRMVREAIIVTAEAIDYPQNQKTSRDWIFEQRIFETLVGILRLIMEYYIDREENKMDLEVAAAACKIAVVLAAHSEFGYYDPDSVFLKVISVYEEAHGVWCVEAVEVATHLGKHYNNKGDYQKALMVYESAMEQYERRFGKEEIMSIRVADQSGVVYRNLGLYDKALECAKRALQGYRKSLGEEDFETLMAANNMALAYMHLKRYDKALEYNAIAVDGLKKNFGNCCSAIVRAIRDTATIHQQIGNCKERIECLRKHMVESRENAGYDMGSETFEITYALAQACFPDNFDTLVAPEQLRMLMEIVANAMTFYEQTRDPQHPETLEVMDTMIIGLIHQGYFQEAIKKQEENMRRRKEYLVEDHLLIARDHQTLGFIHTLRHRYPQALEEYRKSLVICVKNLGPDHVYVLKSRYDIAMCYSLQNDFENSIEEYSAVLVTMRRVLGKNHSLTLMTAANLDGLKLFYVPI